MAYFLEPENEPYDPQEPLPTTLGFTADHRSYVETLEYKRAIKPIPERLIHKTLEIGGPRPMPDFFCLYKDDLCVSRFRLVLDAFAADAIEYIEMDLRIPSYKNPAD